MVTKALKKTPHRVKKNKLEYGIFVNQILQWSICPKRGRRMRGGWVSDSLLSNIWPGIPGCWGDPGFPPPPRHVSDFRFCPLLRHWECKKSGRNPRKMKQVRVYSYSMLSTSLTKYVLQGNFDLVLQVIKL